MRPALLFFLLTTLPGGVESCYGQMVNRHPEPPKEVPGISFDQLQKLAGLTFCNNGQISVWVDAGLDESEKKAVMAHESKHVEQYRRYPTCEAFEAYYRTPMGRIESETEAYVAGWCAVYDDAIDPTRLKSLYIRFISSYGYPIFEALQTWKKYEATECPGHPEPTNLAP